MLLHILRMIAAAVISVPLYCYLNEIVSLWFFTGVLLSGAAAGIVAGRSRFRLVPAVVLFAVSALLLRQLVVVLAGGLSSVFHSAILDFSPFSFDSGFFPLLPLFLYTGLCWFLVLRRPRFILAEIIMNSMIYELLLWSQGGYNLTIFPHPGMLAALSIVFFVVELSALLLSLRGGGRKARLGFAAIVLPLFLAVVFLMFGRYSEGASRDGGGLMQPTLFRFDFSDYVKLETEISMDNDLVMLFRNYGYLNSVYLRRFYLSGYRPERGFFLQKGPGEPDQQLSLPDKKQTLKAEHFPKRVESEQEYFIVNFDPSSLIAMNYPVEIIPLTNWNDSSFLRNYRVISESVEMPSWELSESPLLEMEAELYDFYTEYGEDERIRELAERVTEGLETPYDKVVAILFYLRDSYYYSLKPGVAADGNQLHYFLFDAKKGYCSYFAFSMALMCRSIGIPARVTAGFFIDPSSGILNVYPVREDMAHAWVEVPFEDFGWVEFDPTTDRLAPGEQLEFGALDSSEYSDLVEEIISNDYSVDSQKGPEESAGERGGFAAAIKRLSRLLRMNAGWLPLIFYAAAILIFHLTETVGTRSKAAKKRMRACYRRAVRLTTAFGLGRQRGESVMEHAERLGNGPLSSIKPVAESYLKTVFSNRMDCSSIDEADNACRSFLREYRLIPKWKRLIIFIFPFLRFRGGRAAGILLIPLAILLLFNPQPASADEQSGINEYLEMAAMELEAENYEAALRILKDGMSVYPESWKLTTAAGDIYSDRELYHLALDYYGLALGQSPGNPEILYKKSVAEGLLNLDEQSIMSLEELLRIEPEHYDGLADLGWMYFKTFRLNEAEGLLLEAIEIYDDSPILNMTLGTVYSGLYDYKNSEKYYIRSIEMALDKGWDYFASVSYYNLSLLEYGFYNYRKALEYTNKSIEYGERAPGYISRAEIYLGRLDFENAYQSYQTAYSVDSTPLALMGQAELNLTFGMLDEALAHIDEVVKYEDKSWMYYFGVDPERHRMETDRILMDIYRGMAMREKYSPAVWFQGLKSVFNRVRYSVLGWYHERRYRRASFEVGRSNERQGNTLDAAWAYFIATENYRPQALRYLSKAKLIETSAAPAAEGAYLLEEGRLKREPSLLRKALAELDPEWERLQLSVALTELLKDRRIYYGTSAIAMVEELYELNPGIFIREGIKFPLAVDFKAGILLRHSLRKSGFSILLNNSDNDYRYRLSAADTLNEGILFSVFDSESDRKMFDISVSSELNTLKKVSAFTAELKKRFFSISDGKDVNL